MKRTRTLFVSQPKYLVRNFMLVCDRHKCKYYFPFVLENFHSCQFRGLKLLISVIVQASAIFLPRITCRWLLSSFYITRIHRLCRSPWRPWICSPIVRMQISPMFFLWLMHVWIQTIIVTAHLGESTYHTQHDSELILLLLPSLWSRWVAWNFACAWMVTTNTRKHIGIVCVWSSTEYLCLTISQVCQKKKLLFW